MQQCKRHSFRPLTQLSHQIYSILQHFTRLRACLTEFYMSYSILHHVLQQSTRLTASYIMSYSILHVLQHLTSCLTAFYIMSYSILHVLQHLTSCLTAFYIMSYSILTHSQFSIYNNMSLIFQ